MTKHKSENERIREILDAAAEVVMECGYSGLTMESIVAHTDLSKGGVYRFFSDKKDVALALFKQVLEEHTNFDIDDVLSWNLPIQETIRRLVFRWTPVDTEKQQHLRVWLQLLPLTLQDTSFADLVKENQTYIKSKYHSLIEQLVKRDSIEVPGDLHSKLESLMGMGLAYVQGLALVILTGIGGEELLEQEASFVDLLYRKALTDDE